MKQPLPLIHPPARRSKPPSVSEMAGIALFTCFACFAVAWLLTWLVCEVSKLNP